jgi:hypothetical protein
MDRDPDDRTEGPDRRERRLREARRALRRLGRELRGTTRTLDDALGRRRDANDGGTPGRDLGGPAGD